MPRASPGRLADAMTTASGATIMCPVCRKAQPVYANGECQACAKRKFGRIKQPPVISPAATGKKRRWTAEEDDVLRREYNGHWRTTQDLAWKLTRTFFSVRGRSQALGLTIPRPQAWSDEEIAYLSEYYQSQSPAAIAAHLGRSRTAIVVKLQRLHLHRRGVRDGWYTQRDAADLLGLDSRKLGRYIQSGALKATSHYERGVGQNGMNAWHIEAADLRAFVIRYAHQLQGRNVEMVALVELLVGGAEGKKKGG